MDGCTGCSLKHEYLVQYSQIEDIISGLKTSKKHRAKCTILRFTLVGELSSLRQDSSDVEGRRSGGEDLVEHRL